HVLTNFSNRWRERCRGLPPWDTLGDGHSPHVPGTTSLLRNVYLSRSALPWITPAVPLPHSSYIDGVAAQRRRQHERPAPRTQQEEFDVALRDSSFAVA